MTFAHPDAFTHSPAAKRHGLENARQIIRDPKDMHSDTVVLEACSYLMAQGDGLDFSEAEKVQQAVMSDLWKRRRDHHEEEEGAGGLILLGLAVVGMTLYAVTGWPL